MNKTKIHQENKLILALEKFRSVFLWLNLFYPKSKGTPVAYLLSCFFLQKIIRINGKVTWPVHFTSRVFFHKRISLGNNSNPGLNIGCYIQGRGGIEIGHNLRMGPNVGLISANHDPNDYDQWIKTKPIRIGDNVWIGMGVVVLPGVQIGNNVIIAANSVVTKDIPSNVIAGGIPCKVLKEKAPYAGKDCSQL